MSNRDPERLVLGRGLAVGLAVLFAAARPAPAQLAAPQDPARPNVLLVIADDMGVDKVAAYDAHPSPAQTPVMDALANAGVLFRNAWSSPVCSPSRALMLTGRQGDVTGVGNSLKLESANPSLDTALVTLPERLARLGGYRTAAIGKWHLATQADGAASAAMHPVASGFELHRGSLDSFVAGDGPNAYYHWTKNVADARGAQQLQVDAYATTESVDDALQAIDGFGDDPWFVWLAFNAPHPPLHAPPDDLHDYALNGQPVFTPVVHTKAAIQALDTELGRLLAGIRPGVLANTTVIVVGDNGCTSGATQAPWPAAHAKGTAYQGGVHVPLIVAGAGVSAPPGSRSDALVGLVDVYATVCELAGIDLAGLGATDSLSFAGSLADPLAARRSWLFTERFRPPALDTEHDLWRRAARDARFKLVRNWEPGLGEDVELYDLLADPLEQRDLLASPPLTPDAQAALEQLDAVIRRQQARLDDVPLDP